MGGNKESSSTAVNFTWRGFKPPEGRKQEEKQRKGG